MFGGACILFPFNGKNELAFAHGRMDADSPAPRVVTNPDETDIASMTVPLKP